MHAHSFSHAVPTSHLISGIPMKRGLQYDMQRRSHMQQQREAEGRQFRHHEPDGDEDYTNWRYQAPATEIKLSEANTSRSLRVLLSRKYKEQQAQVGVLFLLFIVLCIRLYHGLLLNYIFMKQAASTGGFSRCSITSASSVIHCLPLPCLALPCLALPCLALPCLALPCLALPCLALPCLA
jgi:hypothetical protein